MERQTSDTINPIPDGSDTSEAATRPVTLLIRQREVRADPADNTRKTPPDPALEDEMLLEMKARVLAGQHPQKQPVEAEQTPNGWRLVSGFTRHRVVGRLIEWADAQKPRPEALHAWGGTLWVSPVAPKDGYARGVINLRENLIRSELPAADLAEAVSNLRKETGRDVAQIARDIGRPLSGIANIVRAFEQTTPEMWAAFRKGAIQQKAIIGLAAQTGEEQRLSFEHLMGIANGTHTITGTPIHRDPPKAASGPDAARQRETGGDRSDDDSDAQPAAGNRAGYTVHLRAGVLRRALRDSPGFKDSKTDFAAGLRAAVRFIWGTDATAEKIAGQMEALMGQVALRDGRAPQAPPDPRQLVIPGAESSSGTTGSSLAIGRKQAKPASSAKAKLDAAKTQLEAAKARKAKPAKAKAKAKAKPAKAAKGRR